MIKHIVMFKLKPEAPANTANKIKALLDALPAQISEILSFEVGINEKQSDRACDLVLVSEFESFESLTAYAMHPKHVDILPFIRENCSETKVVDYSV